MLGRYSIRSVSSYFCNLKFDTLRLIKANYVATVNTLCCVGLVTYVSFRGHTSNVMWSSN